MLLLEIKDIKQILLKEGYKSFYKKLVAIIEQDYALWETFDKIPRVASHAHEGVIELMPINNEELYSFKYVNGHPNNPKNFNKSCVMATGQLSDAVTGEPLLYAEMTLLTALRTSASSMLAARYMARKESETIAIIGNGAQSEFHFLAFSIFFPLQQIRFYDIDPTAMEKFHNNIKSFHGEIVPCKSVEEAVKGADIIITMTAQKKKQQILSEKMITKKPVFISAIGGDCPGKTELNPDILNSDATTIVIEFLPQTKIEGEIQNIKNHDKCIELYKIIRGEKKIDTTKGINLFDSVGFALEDYGILKLVYKLASEYNVGSRMSIVPNIKNVKDLYASLKELNISI